MDSCAIDGGSNDSYLRDVTRFNKDKQTIRESKFYYPGDISVLLINWMDSLEDAIFDSNSSIKSIERLLSENETIKEKDTINKIECLLKSHL